MVLSLDTCKYSVAHRLSKLEIRKWPVRAVLRVGLLADLQH
jgi:hypothetical protein